MKQNITSKQFESLNSQARIKLQEWCEKHGYHDIVENKKEGVAFGEVFILISIGQMIEFLGDSWHKGAFICTGDEVFGRCDGFTNETLCDYLWEAVKEVLEK